MPPLRPTVLAALTLALTLAAVLWTVTSASALSLTFDEPHHLAPASNGGSSAPTAGGQNPPLPKVLTALLPYLTGMRLPGPPTPEPGPWDAGIKLLEDDGARALLLARLGTIRGCC